jgi:hypothetical protein
MTMTQAQWSAQILDKQPRYVGAFHLEKQRTLHFNRVRHPHLQWYILCVDCWLTGAPREIVIIDLEVTNQRE